MNDEPPPKKPRPDPEPVEGQGTTLLPVQGQGKTLHNFFGPKTTTAQQQQNDDDDDELHDDDTIDVDAENEPQGGKDTDPKTVPPAFRDGMGVVLTVNVAGTTAGRVAELPVLSVRERPRYVTLNIGGEDIKTNAQNFDFNKMGSENMVEQRVSDMQVGGGGITSIARSGAKHVHEANGCLLSVEVLCWCGKSDDDPKKMYRKRAILWCGVCGVPVNANNALTSYHLSTDTHKKNVSEKLRDLAGKKTMDDWLAKYRNKNPNLPGSTVSQAQDRFRLRVVRALMQSGIPLNKLNNGELMSLITEDRPSLPVVSHLRESYVPMIRVMEIQRIQNVLNTNDLLARRVAAESSTTDIHIDFMPITVIFDGSTLVDNHLAVIFRFCTKDLQVFEVAVALTKYLVNRNSCHLINAIDFVCNRYDIQKNQIVQWMCDRCSVNLAALPQLIDNRGGFGGECLAHTMDNCDVMAVAWMQIFTELLVAMMSSCGGNNKAMAHWSTTMRDTFRIPNNTRWWAVCELQFMLYERFDSVCEFILTLPGDGLMDEDSSRLKKLSDIITCPKNLVELRFELRVNLIVNKFIVQATYQLEGSSPSISTVAYNVVAQVENFLNDHTKDLTFPGLHEAFGETADTFLEAQRDWINRGVYPANDPHMQAYTRPYSISCWKAKAKAMITPVTEYFKSHFCRDLTPQMNRLKTLRYVNPMWARSQELVVPPKLVDDILHLKWRAFDRPFAEAVAIEYPSFVKRCKEVLHEYNDTDNDPKIIMSRSEEFWKFNYHDFPKMAELLRYAWTSTSSSASAERLFSMLKHTFTKQQLNSALSDYVEGSVMLAFNAHFIQSFPALDD